MLTIGVDPHKQTHTAAAVNDLGVEVERRTAPATPAATGGCWSGLAPLNTERVRVPGRPRRLRVAGGPLIDRGGTVVVRGADDG
jgi:hypothetical protein